MHYRTGRKEAATWRLVNRLVPLIGHLLVRKDTINEEWDRFFNDWSKCSQSCHTEATITDQKPTNRLVL